jgi:hypothetical protein
LPEERPRQRKKAEADEPEAKPERGGRTRAAAKSGGGVSPIVLILVGGYAVFATIAAVYGLFIKSGPDTGHPLSTIPDNFGEFPPATRTKPSAYRFPVDGELPPEQRTRLGGKVVIGQVEVQPVRIEKRKLVVETERTDGEKRPEASRVPAFVMTLAIKNASSDLTLFPMDPAFTRRAKDDDRPITRLVVNRSTVFPGGYIDWPLDPTRIKKRIEQQQANDSIPLKPGETREYVVFTDAKSDIIREVEGAKDTMQWRVQVRRGPITFRGKEVPVTAIVGVDFKASEIKTPE